jgi:nonribosomal peptide synthetase DhbF
VIYTSGSTGTPKAVIVTHHNVTRLFEATGSWFQFGPTDVWTLFHSYAFDFSVWELWGALLYGGRLLLIPRMVTRSPADFLAMLVQQRVTVLNQTPSAFYQLMQAEHERPELCGRSSLRYIIFGGEKLEFTRLAEWYCRHVETPPLLVNMYGITETTVHVTYEALNCDQVRQASTSCIGSNIPDLRLYILDENLGLMPVGVTGELYVAGKGLARGYLNRPALTAERFVADAYAAPGERMYRTGDLARWSTEGTLTYFGRNDRQVKIRGFRIETGEIEAALLSLAGITQAAVVARDGPSGNTQLIAYFVYPEGPVQSSSELRRQLSERLPDYMLPAAFQQIDALPLTSNGKLDGKALPAPEFRVDSHLAPRTGMEKTLCGIVAELLELKEVGIDDNFFDLGGHSLTAIRLVRRVREAVHVDLHVREVFTRSTVRKLSVAVEELRSTANMNSTERSLVHAYLEIEEFEEEEI